MINKQIELKFIAPTAEPLNIQVGPWYQMSCYCPGND